MADTDRDDFPTTPQPSKAPLVMGFFSVACVVVMGIFMVAKNARSDGHTASGAAVRSDIGPTVKPADFTVRLRNTDVDRYVRLGMEIELAGDRDKQMLVAHMPQVRDAVITYLSDRTLEELRGSEGMNTMKETLRKTLAGMFPTIRVQGIYITEFVSQ